MAFDLGGRDQLAGKGARLEAHRVGASENSSQESNLGNVQEPPTRTTCLKKVPQYTSNLYSNMIPVCIAVLSWLLSRFQALKKGKRCSTPPRRLGAVLPRIPVGMKLVRKFCLA